MDLLLHPKTQEQIDNFLNKPAHSLLLSAPMGAGKLYIAEYIAKRLLDLDEIGGYAFFHHIQAEHDTITIDNIRQLKNLLQLKTTGRKPIRRVVIIEQAEAMNHEAQNALLKVLEEPPTDTVIIMTTDNPNLLLPTIKSRTQTLHITKPSKQSMISYFSSNVTKSELERVYHMSGGQTGLMQALLADTDSQHPLAEHINLAKDLLKDSAYERLLKVNDLAKHDLAMTCYGLYSVAHAALVAAADKNNLQQTKRWYQICKVIHKVQDELKYKPQPKLVLTNLLLNL